MAMPNTRQFDLSDPALRQEWGLQADCTGTISVQTHFRRIRRQYRSGVELRALVFNAVKDSASPLSRRQIANAIGVSKNWYLLNAIAELVALGLLRELEDDWRGIPMFRYEVQP